MTSSDGHRMTHKKTLAGLLLGLAATAALAAWLGGSRGTGALLGFLLGGALTLTGIVWQAHWMRRRAERALRAQLEAFLVKLAALAVFAVLFRSLPLLAERVDWRAFAVAFAAAVAWLLPIGTWENAPSSVRARAAGAAAPRGTL
jgi:hypothetical protein